MAIEDLWYKNAILYCLDVEKYLDADGDGVGDFEGLRRRLDYLAGLGVSCLWLQPFYPSPNRDDGYDVSDYYGVHPKHGSLGEFVEFMNHARAVGIRVLVDLVGFQADLDTADPRVRGEIARIMGFWLELGVSGFRMDAVPFLIERKGAGAAAAGDFAMLDELRRFLQRRRGDAILLAEGNLPPDESLEYFGAQGERLQMMLNFPVNQRLFYALATGEIEPLCRALEQTRPRHHAAQWLQFLRSDDGLELGRLRPEQRARVLDAFAPDPLMQLHGRGLRRRLAPMLGNERRRLELAYSLLFSLPGTPLLQYGDEIGMGEDLELPERECARTPMQWTSERHGGFSRSELTVRPVVCDDVYGYDRVNVADQLRNPQSLLNWIERMIRMRKQCPEIAWGDFTILRAGADEVLALRYDWHAAALLILHNFAAAPRKARLRLDGPGRDLLVDIFEADHSRGTGGVHEVELAAYGYRWFRVGAADNTLQRSRP